MMQPVVRYSQNASNSNGADPRKPWPPQPEMAWLNVFARVPGGRRRRRVEAVFTTVVPARQRGRAAEGRDRRRSRRDPPAARRADRRLDRLSSLRRLGRAAALRAAGDGRRCCWRSRAATSPACCCRARPGARAKWRSASRSARGRARLVRQMLAESLLLAVAGGLVGITFAVWARDALLGADGQRRIASAPLDLNTGLDWRVLGFSLAVSALTGLGCGVLPAFRGTRVPVAEALKQEGRGSVSEGGRRGLLIGKALVAVADGLLPPAARRRGALHAQPARAHADRHRLRSRARAHGARRRARRRLLGRRSARRSIAVWSKRCRPFPASSRRASRPTGRSADRSGSAA